MHTTLRAAFVATVVFAALPALADAPNCPNFRTRNGSVFALNPVPEDSAAFEQACKAEADAAQRAAKQRAADAEAYRTHTETPAQQQRRLDRSTRGNEYAAETEETLVECSHNMIAAARRANRGVEDQKAIAYQRCGSMYVMGMGFAYQMNNNGAKMPDDVRKRTANEAAKVIDSIVAGESQR
jgi:hypothetical protein